MRRLPLVLVLAAALAAGCGGGGDSGDRTPQQELEAVLPDYEEAVAAQDCRGFARFVHSAVRAPGKRPDDPPTPEECSNFGVSYTRLEGFRARRTKVFGSAAIVEGHIDGQLIALIWTLDVDGRWKQVQATPPGTSPQIRGHKRPVDRYAPNAALWVQAMRRGDCRGAFRLLNPASPLVGDRDDRRDFCRRFRTARSDPQRLPAQLAQAPAAKPRGLGGTPDFRFFSLDTGRGRRWTIIMATLPPGLPAGEHVQDSVLDYYPNSRPTG